MCSVNKLGNFTHDNAEDRKVVFFGSPLIDITATVDLSFLRNYCLEPDNAYTIDETNRRIFDDIAPKSVSKIGGSVTNTVRIFRKYADFPQAITYLGSIGKDSDGQMVKEELRREGITSALQEIDGESTGKVAVLLEERARTLVTDLGASRFFSMDAQAWSAVKTASFVYFSGFFIGVSFSTITQVVSRSAALIAVNLGAPFLCTKYPNEMLYLYSKADLVFGNEAEHRAFAGIVNVAASNIVDIVNRTNQQLEKKSRVVVVTRADKPVLAVYDNTAEKFDVTSLDGNVDTNGAGDAFVGGFLAAYVGGGGVPVCVRAGITAANLFIRKIE